MKKLLLFSLFTLLASAMGWAATETWVKVTSKPASWDGDYLIVYEGEDGNSSEVLNVTGIAKNQTVSQDSKKVTISDNTIITEDCDFFVTIKETTTSGQYSITSKSGYQIGIGLKSTDKNQLYTGALTNTLSLNKNNEIQIRSVQNTNMYLRRNKDYSYFRYYTSGQKPIALYKKATKVAPLEYSPAFGDIAKGTVVTISCATEGAVLNGTIKTATGTATLKGEKLPYTYKASELGELKVAVYASKEGLDNSEVLTGTYNVCKPKVAALEIKPGFGTIEVGTEITISCATEGAVLNGTIGTATLEGAALPYIFTASELGELKVEVYASKDGFEDSEVLTGTYNVCQPKVAALEIKPGFGTIEVGTEITISCATEGAFLNGLIGDTDVTNAPLPYTFTADKEGEISVLLTASKKGYDESEQLYGDFIVKAAVPVAYRDVITVEDYTGTSSYTELSLVRTGATYSSKAYLNTENICLQFNNKKDKQAGIVMKESKAFVSKIIITWNISGKGAGFEIYGKNSPYEVAADLYDTAKTGTLIESCAWTKNGDVTEIDLSGKPFTFIGVKPTGVTYINSIEFIWNESEAGNADVTYTKASEAKAGNFAVLATADGKAIGRNADLNPVNVTVSSDAIGLNKNQADIDEFEIVEKDAANKTFQLCGGLSKSRRYLTYDAAGVTTVATADANADVTFVSTAAGLLVKFKDGKYLMFNGTKFIKADYDYGEAVVQADGETLTPVPVIVFMSSSNVSTGVETVEFDENAEAQYFNLNGVQVKAENLTPGLYIVRQGNKVSKQVIR